MNKQVAQYLAEIGRKGGKKSRRKLKPEVARGMVRVREAKKAYRDYHASCFWSYDPALSVSAKDVPWVAEQLKKNGNRKAWEVAARLCR